MDKKAEIILRVITLILCVILLIIFIIGKSRFPAALLALITVLNAVALYLSHKKNS